MSNDTLLYRTYPDEYIDYWGGVFLANPCLRRRGVRFDTFLIAPRELLAKVMAPATDADGHAPLLPHQRRIRARVEGLSHLRAKMVNAYREVS